MYTKEEIKWRG